MWIEQRGLQHRVYWRTGQATPKKAFEAFASRDQADLFIQLARMSSLHGALAYVRDPRPQALAELLGRPVTAAASSPAAADHTSPGYPGPVRAEASPHLVGLTFAGLWERFLEAQRHLEETTEEDYAGYGRNHLLPFFGAHDLGLIHRSRPLRDRDALPGAVYVDEWVKVMLAKPKTNNVGAAVKDSHLAIKSIKNNLTVLAQAFDLAIQARPALLEVNPAREIRLPKQDRREMFFLDDEKAYLELRCAMPAHFQPLLDFLVGTGARFGEAAGLQVGNLHLEAPRPFLEIRLVLKWAGKKWKLGRPKTRSSVRRITLSPGLVQMLRPLVSGKPPQAHVFTMVEGAPLHHGNFYNRYFRPAVKAAAGAVPARLRIHDLRHTHAAWLISDGAPIVMVQRRLGHSSSVTTQDVYGHLTPEADERFLSMVDRRLPAVLARDESGAVLVKLSRLEASLPEFDVDDEDDLAA
jgi:integrase